MDDQVTCRPVPSEARGAARLRRVEGGRQHVIKVKLDDTEYRTIGERAAALRVSIQRFLVSGALAPRSPAAAPRTPSVLIAELAGLRRLTANLANNINQIARVLNSGGTPGGSIPAAADAVRRVMIRLDSVLATLAPDPSVGTTTRSAPPSAGHGSLRPPGRAAPEAPS